MKRYFAIFLLVALCSCGFQQDTHAVSAPVIDTFRVIHVVDSSRLHISEDGRINSLFDDYTKFVEGKNTDTDAVAMYKESSIYGLFYEKEQAVRKFIPLAQKLKLPSGAKIMEVQYLADRGYPNRAIVLWMTGIKMNVDPGDLYMCPDVTNGKYSLEGLPHFSLIDVAAMKILNTETVEQWWESETVDSAARTITRTSEFDPFTLPMVIGNPKYKNLIGGLAYHATGGTDSLDGMAQVLYLDDYNGDGQKLEWALYKQDNCVLKSSRLMGYSPRRDSILTYPIRYKVYETSEQSHRDTSYSETIFWVDHEFCYKLDPARNTLRFAMDYRGRGGPLMRCELHYDKKHEEFYGTKDMRIKKGDNAIGLSWCSVPIQY